MPLVDSIVISCRVPAMDVRVALVVVVFPLFGSQLSITSLMTIIIIIRRPAPRVVEWVEEKEALFQITTQKVVKKKKEKNFYVSLFFH